MIKSPNCFVYRYGFQVKLDGSEQEIENAILQHAATFRTRFHEIWSSHLCDVKGCGTWLVCDGGLKPHRVVCSARYSGIRSYKHSNMKTVTGCTRKPAKDKKFCPDHVDGQEGPVVLAEHLSAETKRSLRKKQSPDYPQDNLFFVRAILKIENDNFLVQWVNTLAEEATWEPRKAIPKFIVEWYEEDHLRLGSEIPSPKIKWSKEAGKGQIYYFLSWGKGGTMVAQEEFQESIFDMDSESFIPESTCNTRKV